MASADLSIGLSGLQVAQNAMQTIGHNIANVNSPGYSRQKVSITANTPNMSLYGPIGAGVTIDQIQRIKDDLLDTQINSFTSLHASSEIQSDTLRNLEAIFNEMSEYSLNGMIEKFFSSLQNLSTSPELSSTRYQLLQDALNMTTNSFRSLNEQFKKLQANVGQKIESKITELNSITSEIAQLNKRIGAIEFNGTNDNANDMLDKRDFLINKLSKLADIRVISNDNNSSVDIQLGGALVVNANRSETISTSINGENIVEIRGLLSDSITSGELKGLLEMQNVTLPEYLNNLDTLAASIIKEVNNIHSEGIGLNGGFTSITSTNAVNSSAESLTDTGLPFAPSVNTYTTGTVISADNGDGTSTVTGSSTSFISNAKVNDWVKLNDGNFYKITSVDSNTQLTVSGAYTDATSTSTNITDGNLYITVTDSSNAITKTNISIAADETLNSLSTKISGIANVNTSITNGVLSITSDDGYSFAFTRELDKNPGSIGNSEVSLSGNYTGNDNNIYTLTVRDAGTGSIGTGSAVIRVTNASGAVMADLDVGSSYTVGSSLQIADGVSINFGSGNIALNQKLTFDVVNDPDTSNVLTSLGINTFFEGKDSSTIEVTQYIKDNVSRIAAASTNSPGDNTNALRLSDLQNTVTTNNSTFSDFLHSTVARLGIITAQKASEKDSFNSLLTNLNNRRQEVSGVSIEEEMINTLRFQQAFQASSRYIATISEMNQILMQI